MMADSQHYSTPPQLGTPGSSRSVEGSQASAEENRSSSPASSSTPPYVRWCRGLDALLEDSAGKDAFENFLTQEGCLAQLHFLWACEGLKLTASEDPPKLPQLIRSIYRHFIQNTTLFGLQEASRAQLTQAIVDSKTFTANVFDTAEDEVQTHMRDHLYPNFLKSDIYLQAANEDYGNQSSSSTTAGLSEAQKSNISAKDCSVATDGESSPELQAKSSVGEIFPPRFSQTVPNVQNLLPTNLQTVPEEDSDHSVVQQHSSHGGKIKLTKEALLATQSNRVAASSSSSRKVRQKEIPVCKVKSGDRENGSGSVPFPYHANYSSYNPVSRVDSEIQSLSSDGKSRKHSSNHRRPHAHHDYKQSHSIHHNHYDKRYGADPKLRLMDDNLPNTNLSGVMGNKELPKSREAETQPAVFAEKLIRKLEDVVRDRERTEHLGKKMSNMDSRVIGPDDIAAAFKNLQKSSEDCPAEDILDHHVHRLWPEKTPTARSPHLHSPNVGRRRMNPVLQYRDKDGCSIFSADSGNVQDYDPYVRKSASVPHDLKQPGDRQFARNAMGPHHSRSRHQGFQIKRTSSDLIDSGISVASESHSNVRPPPIANTSNMARTFQWVQSTDDSKQISQTRPHRKANWPSEEAKKKTKGNKTVLSGGAIGSGYPSQSYQMPTSSNTTLLRHHSPCSSEDSPKDVICIVYYDDAADASLPFQLKIPFRNGVCLSSFKDVLPKRGNYRYFFKSECAEKDIKVVQEEVTDDNQILPLYEGKIIAHLQANNPSSASSQR